MKQDFYNRKPEIVARELLGKLLVRNIGKKILVGKIVETEAYLSKNDSACHASKGKTNRNEAMFLSAGHIYVYLIYGIHHCLNIVTEKESVPSAVLIRAIEPLLPMADKKTVSGPGRLTKWMKIDKNLNGEYMIDSPNLYINDKIVICGNTITAERVTARSIIITKRIGVENCQDRDKLLRFYIKDNQFISKI